jgi:transcriptional regulator GlxA family with amidase domain
MTKVNTRRIGIIGFDGVTALDIIGPLEAFAIASANVQARGSDSGYELLVLGLTKKRFVAESGVGIVPNSTLDRAPAMDTIIIPGGAGLRTVATSRRVAAWISTRNATVRRIASVCTGIYGLAPTGLLDGRRVTTHWRFARDVAQRFPKIVVEPNAIYLKDGPFYTSAGITAGIDLSLALIEEDHGPSLALSVARELVLDRKRGGGQEQYSEPLQFQVNSADRFADLAAWISGHLRHDLTVVQLAERACLSARHFSRQFTLAFGSAPAAYVDGVRLDEARRRLTTPRCSVDAVAASVGFRSTDAFRRAFVRRFGISPTTYRVRFALPGSPRENISVRRT